jgi:GNAT superfamily N-acetyltransferase
LDSVSIVGYYHGLIGKVTQLHATYYHDHWGLDRSFEIEVAKEFSEFAADFVEGRDAYFTAMISDRFAGFLAVDGRRADDEGVRLRWFIVEPAFQGQGIGKELFGRAIDFCREKRYEKIYLWTFRGLTSARSLYDRYGFRIVVEDEVVEWGQRLTEQKFELTL